MAYDIFISYRRDRGVDKARSLQLALEKYGNYKVFFDYTSLVDDEFNPQILTAIEEAPIFILLMTEGCMTNRHVDDNDWVQKELTHAIKYLKKDPNRKMIPINVDDKFDGFSEELCADIEGEEGVGSFVNRQQFSIIYTNNIFEISIKNIIDNRISKIIPVRKKIDIVETKNNGDTVTLKITTDENCLIIKDGELIADGYVDTFSKITLSKGIYCFRFISKSDPSIFVEQLYTTGNQPEDVLFIKLANRTEKSIIEKKKNDKIQFAKNMLLAISGITIFFIILDSELTLQSFVNNDVKIFLLSWALAAITLVAHPLNYRFFLDNKMDSRLFATNSINKCKASNKNKVLSKELFHFDSLRIKFRCIFNHKGTYFLSHICFSSRSLMVWLPMVFIMNMVIDSEISKTTIMDQLLALVLCLSVLENGVFWMTYLFILAASLAPICHDFMMNSDVTCKNTKQMYNIVILLCSILGLCLFVILNLRVFNTFI